MAEQVETAELRRLLDERERQAARIDARGLPVVGFGILLSGVPDELASFLYPFGWLLPIFGIVITVTAGVSAWRERHPKP